jgi:hypothetical protein
MNLKLNSEIKISAWLDADLICNSDWHVYSSGDEDDAFYILAKDPQSGRELKFKVEKTIIIEESSTQ